MTVDAVLSLSDVPLLVVVVVVMVVFFAVTTDPVAEEEAAVLCETVPRNRVSSPSSCVAVRVEMDVYVRVKVYVAVDQSVDATSRFTTGLAASCLVTTATALFESAGGCVADGDELDRCA